MDFETDRVQTTLGQACGLRDSAQAEETSFKTTRAHLETAFGLGQILIVFKQTEFTQQ